MKRMLTTASAVLLTTAFAMHASAEPAADGMRPAIGTDVVVRFEVQKGETAELELIRTVNEKTGEEGMAFTGQTVSEDGAVLIESFTIGTDMEHIASVADAYHVTRRGETAVARAGGAFEFLTLDGEAHPSAVVAGTGEDQMDVRVDIFRGRRVLQRRYEDAGGEGSVAVAFALMFRDLHTNVSRRR